MINIWGEAAEDQTQGPVKDNALLIKEMEHGKAGWGNKQDLSITKFKSKSGTLCVELLKLLRDVNDIKEDWTLQKAHYPEIPWKPTLHFSDT